ncbi:MAG: hypothetical protein NWF00_03730 [Candidatus Bathyarchaeota archaeon]|nr:hypothetical protein [Candidatus Bathyarchaeota archaeon]
MSEANKNANKNLIHMDIYAIVEATQELYFGNVKDLNINRVELVSVPKDDGTVVQKPYMSPTKVRGVARRALLWELVRLGDQKVLSCGIPATCGNCDVCRLYGALVTTQKGTKAKTTKIDSQGTEGENLAGSIASRVIQAGGVAIQELTPAIKQRLSSPFYVVNGKIGQYNVEEIKKMLQERGVTGDTLNRLSQPMPYEKEYVTGLFSIYWHAYYLETSKKKESKMSEPQMVAFSFLETWKRIGAGHPKGAEIKEAEILGKPQPLIVVDVYYKPLGKRPIISVSESNEKTAIETFIRKAMIVNGKKNTENRITISENEPKVILFERFIGDTAEDFLRKLASGLDTTSNLIEPQKK